MITTVPRDNWLNLASTLDQQLLLVDEIMRTGKGISGGSKLEDWSIYKSICVYVKSIKLYLHEFWCTIISLFQLHLLGWAFLFFLPKMDFSWYFELPMDCFEDLLKRFSLRGFGEFFGFQGLPWLFKLFAVFILGKFRLHLKYRLLVESSQFLVCIAHFEDLFLILLRMIRELYGIISNCNGSHLSWGKLWYI